MDTINLEPLRQFLVDNLVEAPIELEDGELIADAMVIFRIVDMNSPSNENAERYRYTVTPAISLATAFGLLEITRSTMERTYQSYLGDDEEDG